MKLSTKTRYGVRAVFDIAYHNEGKPTLAKDIARRQSVPLRYLEQIFQDLKRAGLVDSKRGPRGGYYLRSEPSEIRLGDIVRALQGPIDEMFAVEEEEESSAPRRGGPPPSSKVVTAALWRDLAAQVTLWFDQVTVDVLIQRAQALGVQRGENKVPMYFI